MTPQEKCQQIADVLGIEVWMAMDDRNGWNAYQRQPNIFVPAGEWIGSWIKTDFTYDTPWQDSLVHAEPRAT